MLEVQSIEAECAQTTCAPLHLYQRLLVAMLNVVVQEGTISANPFYAMERKQKFKKVSADRCFIEN